MTRDEQITAYRVKHAEWQAAQHALNTARREMDDAASALAKRMLADVPAHAVSLDAGFNRVITYDGQDCMVVGKRCHSWEPTAVHPLVKRRIAKGKAWGKTEAVANKVRWDFEAGDWKVEG